MAGTIPDWVDGYRILALLGEGGMGAVYLAEQLEPVQRQVALKILKRGMDTDQVVARFRAERQSLAVMHHPSVATVYDAGATPSGLPYFVMELVEGLPLDEYCDRERLDVPDRVRLFLQICHAVQHAHQKGIIHRDLKPSNILVATSNGDPLPKIIDFGIARAVESARDGPRLTQEDQSLGTPAYMAPEQVEGVHAEVDTRTDIYSLGVVLYELLTGVLPFDAKGNSWALWAKALLEEPPLPSERVGSFAETQHTVQATRQSSLASLRRALRGDLDWIVLKALEKEPARRYATASGFARDIERYLSHTPVEARPPSAAYRTRKFVRRHRAGVSFAALITLMLAGFGVIQAVQANRVRQARDLAEVRRDQAEGLIDYMLSDLREKLEPLGRLDLLDAVGGRAMTYFAAMPVDEFSVDELASRSQALYQLGQVRLEQGDLPAADSVLTESLRLARALSDRSPEDTARMFGLSQSEFWAGELARRRGDLDRAQSHFENYRDLSRDLHRRDTTNTDWTMEVGYSHTNLGTILLARREASKAVEEFRSALEIKTILASKDPNDSRLRFDLSRSHNNLGNALARAGELREARAHFESDVALKRALVVENPTNAVFSGSPCGEPWVSCARVRDDRPAEAGAGTYCLNRWRWIRSCVSTTPTNARIRRNLAHGKVGLARVSRLLGNSEAANDAVSSAVQEFQELVQASPEQLAFSVGLADAHKQAALLAMATVNPRNARAHSDRALAILRGLPQSAPSQLRTLGEVLIVSGDIDVTAGAEGSARAAWQEATRILEGLVAGGEDFAVHAPLTQALLRLGDSKRAEQHITTLQAAGFDAEWLRGVAPPTNSRD